MALAETMAPSATVYRFDAFQLAPAREVLLDGDQPVRIGSRALRILTVLVERAGELIGKQELMSLVWPDTFVEEGNLKVQLSALRRVLGDANGRLIANIPGRGYRFVASVARLELQEPARSTARSAGYVPALLTRLIGRDNAVADLQTLLAQHRFVTLAGPGGIGKSTVAIATTDRLTSGQKTAAFVELAAVPDSELVASAIASALGIRSMSGDPVDQIIDLIGAREILLVLDNCEHVVQRTAEIAENLLTRTPRLSILATSREPLRARGEQVYRLSPLGFPVEDADLDAAGALAYPAVALFVERAQSSADSNAFGDADVRPVVQICRQLDGLPLALELAAAQVHNFGFAELAARLGDRFSLLTRGYRTARPRQQTLRATLDWSFGLLTRREQVLLSRLGVFADAFALEAATSVCQDPGEAEQDLLDQLSNLADKSLLAIDTSHEVVRYALLETTKAYALDRLRTSGEYETIAARRASALRDLFAAARDQWTLEASQAWLQTHRHWLGDVRASLDWALAEDRDIELGASLLLDTAQVWISLGLLPEFFQHAERALEALARREGPEKALQMRLASAVGHAIYELGAHPALTATMTGLFESALLLAQELGDARQEVRALFSQCVGAIGAGEYADVFPLADRFLEVGRNLPDTTVSLLHNQARGIASMMMGRNRDAQGYLEAVLADPAVESRASRRDGFDFDPRISALNLQARVLWMTGFPDQAMAVVRDIVEDALELRHLPSYLNALQGCVMLLPVWYGDADFHADQLERYVTFGQEHHLDYRGLWRTVLDLGWRSNVEEWSFARARQALADLNTPFNIYGNEMWAAYHPGFVLPEMIDRVRAGKSGWCAAEVIRGVGEARLNDGNLIGAREAFDEALALSRDQGARAWELRAATSLCRLDQGTGRGREILASVYDAYGEGFAARDLQRAAALLG